MDIENNMHYLHTVSPRIMNKAHHKWPCFISIREMDNYEGKKEYKQIIVTWQHPKFLCRISPFIISAWKLNILNMWGLLTPPRKFRRTLK
jgi:hypothetical protein